MRTKDWIKLPLWSLIVFCGINAQISGPPLIFSCLNWLALIVGIMYVDCAVERELDDTR